ncbi:MAG: CaiB/BaiF CoA transferase family protein [Gammaproteobacteria bacterium]
MTSHASPGLLAGLKVLDCSLWQPGQYAAQLLADLGAEVIKIEPPGGDRMRFMADRFFTVNGHKRSVVADLKTGAGRVRVLDLARQAEVFIEGFKPGVADRLGVGYAHLSAVNPALVYCSISGFGQSGPLAMHSGHDHNYQAYAGAIAFAGDQPAFTSALIGDQGSGMTAAFAICAALLCARRTGEGERIDVSMADVIAGWVAPSIAVDPSRPFPISQGVAGMGLFATADGFVVLGVFTEDRLWDKLCAGLGLGDAIGLGFDARSLRSAELNARLAGALRVHPRDAIAARLGAQEVPIAPVLSPEEMLELPHFVEHGLFARAPDGTRSIGHVARYRNHPARPPGLPPDLGEHGDGGFHDDGDGSTAGT